MSVRSEELKERVDTVLQIWENGDDPIDMEQVLRDVYDYLSEES